MKTIVINRADGGVSIGDIADKADAQDVVNRWSIKKPASWLPVTFEVMDARPEGIPEDRFFRNAMKIAGGKCTLDITKCKEIAHDHRRSKRGEEFKPLDIEATIPALAAEAEVKRQVVRDKYAAMQAAIDSASSVDQIKAALP